MNDNNKIAPRTGALPELVRALGRWSLVALAINGIIGSAVFALPSTVAAAVSGASYWAVLLAGAAVALIVSCYAEVGSRFEVSGGTYLYVRTAFGRLAGLQASWLMTLARLTALAAAANLFVTYLGEFWPRALEPVPRSAVLTLLIGGIGAANYRGVGGGAVVSNMAVVAKLLPLALICIVGLCYVIAHPAIPVAARSEGGGGWLKALVLLFFAYGGYESSVIAMGEARDPRRDGPFALFVSLFVVTLIYTLVQLIVVTVLPDPARSQRPLADAARVVMGNPGAIFISIGALLSVYGFLSAHLLTAPRGIFSQARLGEFPAILGAIHPRYRTPHVAVAVFASLIWLFALFGTFSWNVTLSAAGRLCYYAAVCAAVPVLRRKEPEAAPFRLKAAWAISGLGVGVCLLLLTQVDFSKAVILVGAFMVALLNWVLTRRRAVFPAR